MPELIDLSIPTLMAACKGNVANLPSFMVHENTAWVTAGVQLDSKNRIHMRRTTFLNAVFGSVPVRPGIWHGLDVQEFHIDLKAHHLQGSEGMAKAKGHQHSRAITKVDAEGRSVGDEDYGNVAPKPVRVAQSEINDARNANGGRLRGIGSTALGANRSE